MAIQYSSTNSSTRVRTLVMFASAVRSGYANKPRSEYSRTRVLEENLIGNNPDTSETITRIVAKTRAIDTAQTADLSLHSRTLRGMRMPLAAYVLSSSCPNSGVIVSRWSRSPNAHVQDERVRRILRLRFGVPCVTHLPADWKCNCGHAGPGTVWRGPARATAGTRPAFPSRAPARPLLQEAMEEVLCRNALAASLNRIPGVQAVLEPFVMTRRAPGDQRRGDIKVIQSGTSWSWAWASFARARNVSSARALTQSHARRQRSTTARRRRRTATNRTSCRSSSKRVGVSTRPACTSSPGSCR
jgi:hypothetical protein